MKEQLISFKTAKLAKEKGFDVKSANKYDDEGRIIEPILQVSYEIYYPFCSQSILQKRLREKHGLYAYIDWLTVEDVIVDYKNFDGKEIHRKDRHCIEKEDDINELLQEALKLIQ